MLPTPCRAQQDRQTLLLDDAREEETTTSPGMPVWAVRRWPAHRPSGRLILRNRRPAPYRSRKVPAISVSSKGARENAEKSAPQPDYRRPAREKGPTITPSKRYRRSRPDSSVFEREICVYALITDFDGDFQIGSLEIHVLLWHGIVVDLLLGGVLGVQFHHTVL